MAQAKSASNFLKLGPKSLESLATLMQDVLAEHKRNSIELTNKFEAIDVAYAMFKQSQTQGDGTGTDVVHGETQCGLAFDDFTIPVVISQVDSFVGYLAEVYLSGYPFFPVVSTPKNIKEAEMFESIVDTHATMGGWGRQFMRAFKNGIKYNFMPTMLEWAPMPTYSVASSVVNPTEQQKIQRGQFMYNKFTSMDAYNTVWDRSVAPADLAAHGVYGGEISLISRIELKRLMFEYAVTNSGYNYGTALRSAIRANSTANNYTPRPTISDYVTAASDRRNANSTNWASWVKNANPKYKDVLQSGMYERFKCFVRIVPSEHLIVDVPEPRLPQIWKIDMISPNNIICAERIFTALDLLPVMIGQPLEDDFELQTHSIAENNIGFQDTASKLINIRFAGARRAISDRGFYDPAMIRQADINSPTPAPKIPVRIPIGSNKKVGDAYYASPYDDSATQGVVQDSQRVVGFSQMLYGTNNAAQGQFQKGNKSVKEWDDTMAFTANRLRLPAICTEFQVIYPLKEQIKWNIFQYKQGGVFQNPSTGEVSDIKAADFEKMQKQAMSFKMSDGYTPTSKIASTDVLSAGLQVIGSSQILQAAYGASLPSMFAHMMSLGGVKDLDQYSPENTMAQGQPPAIPGQQPTPVPGAVPVAGQPAPVGAPA